jgi:hypothetical protein
MMNHDNRENNGYILQTKLLHSDLMSFIKPYLRPNNPVMIFYWGFNFILLAAIVLGMYFSNEKVSLLLDKFFLGFLLFFVLIPFHEWIHGIGYKLAGATSVSYKAEWKKLVFYAMADKFVATKKPFVALAIAPFIIINSILAIGILIAPGAWSWLFVGGLFMHTSGCAGDFALMSYFYTFWELDPVTYDDIGGKTSYFYIKQV